MMDLKDIIKWFIPCFHILLKKNSRNMDVLAIFVFIFLLFNFSAAKALGVTVNSETFLVNEQLNFNRSLSDSFNQTLSQSDPSLSDDGRSLEDVQIGRTFGRPFKKMIAGLLPIIFQMGAATTWAAVATLIGVKTLLVTLAILKLLLIAGAAKVGALFAAKEHHHHKEAWTPQKEVHLHIHNGGHHATGHEEHYIEHAPWSREGAAGAESKPVAVNLPLEQYFSTGGPHEPYVGPQPYAGPQTISTPYGNYVKVGSNKKREIRNLRFLR